MPAFICTACGTQYPGSTSAPAQCVICEEERQYVPPGGQSWTTLEAMRGKYRNTFLQHEANITGIGTEPHFAIGQRAILLQTPEGNVLWDCIAHLDEATIEIVRALGGLKAIAISHPHFYTTMVEWSRAFDAQIHLHLDDHKWVQRPDASILFWEGESRVILPGVTLVRCGGHFPGGTVLHYDKGAQGRGVVCSGDILTVTMDRKFLSFMRSYPNLIPLSAGEINKIAKAMAPFSFDTIYGHYFDRVIESGAKAALDASVARYLANIIGAARGEGE